MLVWLVVAGFAFEVGEDLEYVGRYGFITAGRMRMSVVSETILGTDTVYHFSSEVISNPKYRMFFWLKDRLESYSRTRDLRPLLFVKDIKEKNYEKKVSVQFDQAALKATYPGDTVVSIKPESHDLLGFYYRIRQLNLSPGDTVVINNHADKKNYAIRVTALRREKVKTDFGEWDCMLYEPQTKEKGVFGKDGKLLIWVSDDASRMPVMIKSKMSIGSLSFKISRFSRGGSE